MLRVLHITQPSRSSYPPSSSSSSSLTALPDVLDIPGVESVVTTSPSSPVVDAVSSGGPPIYLLAVVALAGIAAVLVSSVGGGASRLFDGPARGGGGDGGRAAGKEPGPEPIDVSIPYDAAAKMAYREYTGVASVTDPADYKSFKALYEEATVAQVTLKKLQRELATLVETAAKKKQALESFKATSS